MHIKHWTFLSFGLVAIGAAVHAVGCRTNGCNVDPDCDVPNTPMDGGPDTPETCIPKINQEQNKVAVKDDCGVFVRLAGDDTAAGTKSKPFATITRAIDAAKASTKRVYVCAEIFTEALVVPSGIEIYGGLNCAGAWSYSGKRTTVAPAADLVPLTFVRENGDKIHLEDVDARAADAEKLGGSSIAAIADAVPLELVRSDLVAGTGELGENGTTPEGQVQPTSADDMQIAGLPGNNACMGGMNGNLGPMGTTNPYCTDSKSGSGGTGFEAEGKDGAAGTPQPDPNPNKFGAGGVGAIGVSGCQDGQKGADGTEGAPGTGATSLGSIDLAGYVGVNGTDGFMGALGGGGGGGGAAKGKAGCYGAAGGSGGAGGCGGKGGTGGRAGGSSIALISIGATLLFTDVKLTAGSGGNGGDGGDGQGGGVGGTGGKGGAGSGTNPGCNGGTGGVGGSGGKGGGGHGGHSIGIAWKTLAPTELPMGSITFGNPGNGGAGTDADGNGAAGMAIEVLEIP